MKDSQYFRGVKESFRSDLWQEFVSFTNQSAASHREFAEQAAGNSSEDDAKAIQSLQVARVLTQHLAGFEQFVNSQIPTSD